MMMKRVRFDLLWLWDDYVIKNDVCVMIDVASLLLKTILVYINMLLPCILHCGRKHIKVFIPNRFFPNLFRVWMNETFNFKDIIYKNIIIYVRVSCGWPALEPPTSRSCIMTFIKIYDYMYLRLYQMSYRGS